MTERYLVVETSVGPAILDVESDGDYVAPHEGLTERQVEFGAMLLNAGGCTPDGLLAAVRFTECVSCEGTFMTAQVDGSNRCFACAP